jgi:hypothetical protein
MYLKKMKLDKFSNIKIINFPNEIALGIKSCNDNLEVVIYYIDQIDDVSKFISFCNSISFSEDNRTIMVYKKGRKDSLSRDSIITPFKEGKYPNFVFKAPMLCSLSTELSAFVFSKKS